MRLLSYHIYNFGKLSGAKGEFAEGLTVIKQDNSFGKTTLAEFIISMFYGLPDLKVRDLRNERRRYEPWQGGVYGGSITFEFEGRTYQAERDFGKNTLRLWDITALKKEVRSIGGKALESAPLGQLLFEIDKASFKRSAYIPQDDIVCPELDSGLNDKLRNMINATDEGHSLESALKILQKAAEALKTPREKGKIDAIERRIRELKGKIDDCDAHSKRVEQLKQELEKKRARRDEIEEEIKKLDEEIKAKNDLLNLKAEQGHYLTLKEAVEREQNNVDELLPFFKGQRAEDISLFEIKQAIERYNRQLQNVEKLKRERERLVGLKQDAEDRQERATFFRFMIKRLEGEKSELVCEKGQIEAEIARLEGKLKKFKGILHILLCVLSLGLYFLISRAKKKRILERLSALREDVEYYESALEEKGRDIAQARAKLAQNEQEQNGWNEEAFKEIENRLERETELLAHLKRQAEDILGRFECAYGDFVECYYEIEGKYKLLISSIASLEESKAKLNEFLKGRDEQKLSAPLGLDFDLEELEARKRALDEERLGAVKEISSLDGEIKRHEEAADERPVYQGELFELEQKRDHLKGEHENLLKAMEFLKDANDRLAGRYLSPLLEKCRQLIGLYDEGKSELAVEENYKILIKENGTERELDYYSRGIKEIVSVCMRLSLIDVIYGDGQNRPFIILDDPFANLDDKKLERAKEFVKRLSEKYQIIYLTCHASRCIEA